MSSIPPNLLWDAVARQAAGNSFLTPAPQAPASTMPSFPPFPFFPMPPSHQPIVFNNQPPYSPFPSLNNPSTTPAPIANDDARPIDLESDHEQHQQLRAPWNGTFPSPDPQMTQTPPSSLFPFLLHCILHHPSPNPLRTILPILLPTNPYTPKPVARRPKSPIESTKKKASPILGPNQMLKRTGVVALIRHRCPHCQKPFSRKSHLLSHLVIHTDRRDYVCKQCPATFARPHDLQRHLKTAHSEMREFECPKCGVACKRKDSLGKHLLFHCKGVKNGSGGEEETEDDE
ncbi:hypothetical protein BC829DRAFT_390457 [Chytridium lagenaria]|nr:hypothetical protein BC829DRAFT_390457 [Chytridium lagenaria]